MSNVERIYIKGKSYSIAGYPPPAMPHVKYIREEQVRIIRNLKLNEEAEVPGYFIRTHKTNFRVTHELTRTKYLNSSEDTYYEGVLGSYRDDKANGFPCIVPYTLYIEDNESAIFTVKKIPFKRTNHSEEDVIYFISSKEKIKQKPLDFDISALQKPHFSSKDIREVIENAFTGKFLDPEQNIILFLPHAGSTTIEASAGIGDAILTNETKQSDVGKIFRAVNGIQVKGITFKDLGVSYNNIPNIFGLENDALTRIIQREMNSNEVNWIINSGNIDRLTPKSAILLNKSELPHGVYGIDGVDNHTLSLHKDDLAYALFYNRLKNYSISDDIKKNAERAIWNKQKKYEEEGYDPYNIFSNLAINGTTYEKACRAVSSFSRMFGIRPEKAFRRYFKPIFLKNLTDLVNDITHQSSPKMIEKIENISSTHAKVLSIIGKMEPVPYEVILEEIKKTYPKDAEKILLELEMGAHVYRDTQNKYHRIMLPSNTS